MKTKKRLMYLSGEDFYVFCYTVIIALDHLKCVDGKYFKDYRKLAFIIDFISNDKLIYIISNSTKDRINAIDKEYLFGSYTAGLSRRSDILKLLFTLEKRKFVKLNKSEESSTIDVSLNKREIPDSFLDKEVFNAEYKNIKGFCSKIQRLASLKLDTMLDRIYTENGIKTWAI